MRRCWPLLVAVLGLIASSEADEPARKYRVVTPKDDGIIATGINVRGEIVGFEWVEKADEPDIVSQEPFFARGQEITFLPRLKGYTATFPAALSDDGLVVGRASKPAPFGVPVHLRNQAFLWDAEGGIRGLGALEGDSASFACDVTRDGRRISGYSVGEGRKRACVWERDGESWKGVPLPHETQLGSNVVAMSDDGRHVAAVVGNVPCLWTRDEAGSWKREVIGEADSLVPRDVNNAGLVVGLRYTNDGRTHAVIWSRTGGIVQLEKPEGYVRSEANAVNNAGAVVGMVDGPNGSDIGPNAFVYEGGRLRLLDEGGPNFAAATAINDRGEVTGVLEKPEP